MTVEPNGALRVRAPFAAPYLGLRRVLPSVPNTEIWVVLYARVTQADLSVKRNIQIDLRRLKRERERAIRSTPLLVDGEANWSGPAVRAALSRVGLPDNTPLSVLAVELLPELNGSFNDPLGGDLGEVRIFRTSPLAEVDRSCCFP